MTADEPCSPEATEARPGIDSRSLDTFLDFQVRALIETANVIARGMAFYLAFSGALAGYIFTQDVGQEIKTFLAIAGVLLAMFVLIACSILAWGFFKGLGNMEATLVRIDKIAFDEVSMGDFFRRGRVAAVITIGCSICGLFIIVVGLLWYLFKVLALA